MKGLFGGISRGSEHVRVVAESPWRRALIASMIGLVVLLAAAGGFFLGKGTARLDRTYVAALERLDRANRSQFADLKSQLVDAQLAREVDALTARRLQSDIKSLRDERAALREEVTFYKGLMAPATVERGIQIAAFDVTASERAGDYEFHVLLTQVETRRRWVDGDVRVDIRGTFRGNQSAKSEQTVLALTELAEIDPYPLKFRFRYFQDLSGLLTLPTGFVPEAVQVTVRRRGGGADGPQRTFDWLVRDDS